MILPLRLDAEAILHMHSSIMSFFALLAERFLGFDAANTQGGW